MDVDAQRAEIDQRLAAADAKAAAELAQAAAAYRERVAAIQAEQARAVDRYRSALLAAEPDLQRALAHLDAQLGQSGSLLRSVLQRAGLRPAAPRGYYLAEGQLSCLYCDAPWTESH